MSYAHADNSEVLKVTGSVPYTKFEAAILTGGIDPHYAFGLSMDLASKGVNLDVIGSDRVDLPEMHGTPGLRFLSLQSIPPRGASLAERAWRLMAFYVRFLIWASCAKAKIFHILWNNKLQVFDRTLLMLYFRLLGKKVVLTAHNINAGARDGNDSSLNRITLKIQYRLADHIFVHTEKMKRELIQTFGVKENAVTVIPYGVNNAIPERSLSAAEGKNHFGLGGGEKTILFLGAIRPYKGLEYLVSAFLRLVARDSAYRLIIAGERKKGSEEYVDNIREAIRPEVDRGRVIEKIAYIPDEEMEVYFKAADVLALPYTTIFQSGILFLAYSFGLPVIATDVGSFADDVVPGRTGLLCRPRDPVDLADAIDRYFGSELFRSLEARRQDIRLYVRDRHSWDTVGRMTRNVYAELLGC